MTHPGNCSWVDLLWVKAHRQAMKEVLRFWLNLGVPWWCTTMNVIHLQQCFNFCTIWTYLNLSIIYISIYIYIHCIYIYIYFCTILIYGVFISFDKLHHCIVQASYQVDTEARLAASASMQCRSCWKILSCATRWATCEMRENTEVNTKWKNDEKCEIAEVLNFAIFEV